MLYQELTVAAGQGAPEDVAANLRLYLTRFKPLPNDDDLASLAAVLCGACPEVTPVHAILLPKPKPVTPEPQPRAAPQPTSAQPTRSEEHTSEIQSLMRISYAVFCLQKITTPTTRPIQLSH